MIKKRIVQLGSKIFCQWFISRAAKKACNSDKKNDFFHYKKFIPTQITKKLKPMVIKVNFIENNKSWIKKFGEMLKNIIYLQLPKSYNYV